MEEPIGEPFKIEHLREIEIDLIRRIKMANLRLWNIIKI